MSVSTEAMSLRTAREVAGMIIRILQPHCERIEVAGSIRRSRTWINDIEIVCIPKSSVKPAEVDLFGNAIGEAEVVRDPGFIREVDGLIHQHVKGNVSTGRYVQFYTAGGVKVDLFIAFPENWGYIMLIRTGSADFSKMIATRWTQLGYKGEDGFLRRAGITHHFREEVELFDALGLRVPPPHEREMTAEGLMPWMK